MRKSKWYGVAILVGAAGWTLAQSPAPMAEKDEPKASPPQTKEPVRLGYGQTGQPSTLQGRIVAATKLKPSDVDKVLDALGPAVSDLLGQGQTVSIPNLGVFRVVRIPEHRDLINGRPATVGGSNYVEFLATGRFTTAANQPGVQPAETVPPFEYNPLPDQTPGLKVGQTRSPNRRSP